MSLLDCVFAAMIDTSSTQYIHDTYILDKTSQNQTPYFAGEQDRAVLKYFEEVFPLNQRFYCQLTIITCPAVITALYFL